MRPEPEPVTVEVGIHSLLPPVQLDLRATTRASDALKITPRIEQPNAIAALWRNPIGLRKHRPCEPFGVFDLFSVRNVVRIDWNKRYEIVRHCTSVSAV